MKHQKSGIKLAIYLAIVFLTQKSSADWLIVTSNTVSGGPVPAAGLDITKLQQNKMRTDLSQGLSIILLQDKSEQIQLNPGNKTFTRQSIQTHTSESAETSKSAHVAENTTLDGRSAQIFSVSNGSGYDHIWVAPIAQFVKTTNVLSSTPIQSDLTTHVSVGSAFGSNSIVIATEYTISFGFAPPSARDERVQATATATNMTFTIVSKLLSITETNFSASEFEIPPDYKDVTGHPQQQAASIPLEAFGGKVVGLHNLEGLRKTFEQGRPVLSTPLIKPNALREP
jgi:hypothetical protein